MKAQMKAQVKTHKLRNTFFLFLTAMSWGVRFSASPMLDVNKQHTEFGIDPTYKVSMTQEDIEKGKDTIIEAAITHLLSETEKK